MGAWLMLSDKQVLYFNTFGFLILRKLLTPAEMATINDEFMRRHEFVHRAKPFDGTERQGVSLMGADTPLLASFVEDPRFLAIAEELYGEDVIGGGIGGDRYVADSQWHPDVGAEHEGGPKFAIYLQPLDATTGALRVIPGSHKSPFHDEIRGKLGMHMEKSGFTTPELPAYVCESTPGDVAVFDMRTWHASWGGGKDRHMISMVYLRNPRTPAGRALLRGHAEQALNDPEWLARAQGSPHWQRWAAHLRELTSAETH